MDMSQEHDNKVRFQLPVEFVQADYFLCRIRAFEQKYNMNWGDFLAQYSNGILKADSLASRDYTEWAFLCHNFMSELVRMEGADPPGQAQHEDLKKPEFNSGFFIWGDIVRRESILRDRGQPPRHRV